MKPHLCSIAVLSLVVSAAAQPPAPGDWILSSLTSTSLIRLNPATGMSNPFATPPGVWSNCVEMAANNIDLAAAIGPSMTFPIPSSPFVIVTPAGVVSSMVTIPALGNQIDLDQDGSYLTPAQPGTAASGIHALVRVSAGSVVTTVAVLSSQPNAGAIDQDTGDYIAALFSTGTLLRIQRGTATVTTIATGLGTLSGVDFEPRTGTFAITRFLAPQVIRVTPAGTMTTVATFTSANMMKVDDETGNLLVTGGTAVGLLTPAGAVITTRAVGGLNGTGVEVYGARKVSGSGNFAAGQIYNVLFTFQRSSGNTYVAALSMGLRPGIPLPDGRTINLAIDPLLVLSVGGLPGVTTGFTGTLDAFGQGTGTITVPAGFPPGIRIYCSAVAVNAALPSGFETGNSIGMTTN